MKTTMEKLLQGPTFPDREFVRSGATFGEVYAMAARLYTTLADPKYRDTAICLAVENKAIMAAALLASLAGGPSMLLPYAFSNRALARMQQTTGFVTALSDAAREFPQGVEIIDPRTDDFVNIPLNYYHASPQTELLKIFTGGSTGSPQVWSKTGENIFAEGLFLARHYALNEQDCIVATIPPYHIYGLLFSVILPLVSSATVIAGTPSFPGEITEIIEKQEATILVAVPAHYHALRAKKCHDSSLRLAFSSAGMLDTADNEAFYDHNEVGIVEVYGSTETGGIAGRNRSQGEEYFTPFPTIDWKISSDHLAVRSPYISPDLPIDKEKFFITGDRVEARGPNQFLLQGRADGVTKVGGKRVDLEEIRALIKNVPGVSDCALLALPESGGRGHQLGALISGSSVQIKVIKSTLAKILEPYALPRLIKTVDRIPMQANGKYDRAAIIQLLET
jgi:acyl-coenzyme A synthetase/AMP-(fatty) acid ligase